ncbi:MAG: AAA family ATPase, partial [Porticoccaceae bacterium]|nr:AAA family ATPase [Porticoccaceae bacterium]
MLTQLPDVLRYLFSNGLIRQGKFFVGNVRGDKGNSLTVQLNGDKAGLWHDFESGEGGNLFQLWGAVRGFDPRTQFPALIEDVRNWLGAPPPPRRSKGTRPGSTPPDLGPPTGKWDYTDVDGNLLATVYRFDPPGKKKEYRPGDAVRGCMKAPEPRPLYNQPGIAKSETVVLVEGEKCVEALMGQGIPATTAMSGANTAVEKTDWSPLAGKRVIIWPDNDAAGQKYAINCASAIAKAGAKLVFIMKIPEGRPEKWDAADALAENIHIPEFIKNCEVVPIKSEKENIPRIPAFTFGQLYADRAPMPADIIGPRVLTPGGLLVFAGAPKVGKSDFLMTLLAHMAAGAAFLGMQPERPLRVFYLQAEIQYHYLRERLQNLQLGEDVRPELEHNLVITPQICMKLDEAGLQQTVAAIQQHFPNEPPDIIAIDPIRNLFDGGPNGDSENDNNAMLFFLQERVEALRR